MRRLLLVGVAAILGLRAGQSRALGSNDSTGWIWNEGHIGAMTAAGSHLSRWGTSFAGIDVAELFSDVRGGALTKTTCQDLLATEATLELGPLTGWSHALVHASAFLIRGRGLSDATLGSNFSAVSNIEAEPDTRIHELWLEQLFLHRTLSIRIGQMAADSEFAVSGLAAAFLNGSHGWPTVLAADLPGGGPAYPLASPAARVAWLPSRQFAFAVGLYSNVQDPHGTTFPLGTGALFISEGRYSSVSSALPASFTVGYWHDRGIHTGADPVTQQTLSTRSSRSGYYFMLDKTLTQSGHMALAAFARGFLGVARESAVSRFVDAGIELIGLQSSEAEDVLGLAVALTAPAHANENLDPPQAQGQQMNIELTYRVRIGNTWTFQPDIQYVLHPGSQINPNGEPSAIPDAVVAGVRISYEF